MPAAELDFAVLRSRGEIQSARLELERRGLLERPGPGARVRALAFQALGRTDPLGHRTPDPIKSWDVLRALDAIAATVDKDLPVLDMGSVGSAVPLALSRMGYTRVHGIDLDPRVTEMGTGRPIEYVVGDMTKTPWPDGRFAAITSMSVIEHGVDLDALLSELSRLLQPGGVFLFSTDYWAEKLDTSDERIFGLPWTIFSAEEIEAFVARAGSHGLQPAGEVDYRSPADGDRPIHFGGRSYTFLYGALVKRDHPVSG